MLMNSRQSCPCSGEAGKAFAREDFGGLRFGLCPAKAALAQAKQVKPSRGQTLADCALVYASPKLPLLRRSR